MTLPRPLAHELELAAKFAAVSMVGFVADAGGLKLGLGLGRGPDISRLVSLMVALQVTFFLSRWLVFHNHAPGTMARHWWLYMVANSFGGLCNFGIFAGLTALKWPLLSGPWAALVLSSSTAYVINYAGTRLLVYGRDRPAPPTPATQDRPQG